MNGSFIPYFTNLDKRTEDTVPSVFQEISIKLKDGSRTVLTNEDLEEKLKMQSNRSFIQLKENLTKLHLNFHSPPYKNFQVLITNGCQGGLSSTIQTLNPSNCPILVPDLCFFEVGQSIVRSAEHISIDQDSNGLIPEDLLQKLIIHKAKCRENPTLRMPKLLYVNPTGSNPTGYIIPLDNKKKIYKIACDFDLIIVEDDPYYYVYFEKEPISSFQSLDVDGRVVRLDSISKIFFPGIRVGWISAPENLMEKLQARMQNSLIIPSLISQVIVEQILSSWSLSGFIRHIGQLQNFYRERRDWMQQAIEANLHGICKWTVPKAGMFFWIQIPKIKDSTSIVAKGVERGVICFCGNIFFPDADLCSNFFRVTYATESRENLRRGIEILGDVIREELAKADNNI